MANTTFNTRIKLKYDTLANWTTNKAKVLLQGEVGLCYVPAVTNGTTTTAPTVLFKVGDGTTTSVVSADKLLLNVTSCSVQPDVEVVCSSGEVTEYIVFCSEAVSNAFNKM